MPLPLNKNYTATQIMFMSDMSTEKESITDEEFKELATLCGDYVSDILHDAEMNLFTIFKDDSGYKLVPIKDGFRKNIMQRSIVN